MPQKTLKVKKTKKRGTKRTSTSSRGPKKQYAVDPDTQLIAYRPMGGVMTKKTLIYTQYVGLNPGTAGIPSINVFRANGMRDPDVTGAGGQPRGFDQYMAIYDHFVVLGSKITAHFQNSDATFGALVGISVRDESSAPADANKAYPELGYSAMELLGPLNSGNSTTKLVMSINPAKFLGRANPLSDPDLKGSSSVSPTEQCFYHVWAQPQISQDTDVVRCTVVIEYFAAFIEGTDPGAS